MIVSNAKITLPYVPEWAEPVWHLFVMLHPKRNVFQQRLKEAGILTMIHYPIPTHMQEANTDLAFAEGAFPIAEAIAKEFISLLIGSQMAVDGAGATCGFNSS